MPPAPASARQSPGLSPSPTKSAASAPASSPTAFIANSWTSCSVAGIDFLLEGKGSDALPGPRQEECHLAFLEAVRRFGLFSAPRRNPGGQSWPPGPPVAPNGPTPDRVDHWRVTG